ncbi:MAG: alpha/beta hydrolase [Clostridiales bacterium]|nr:alpha/beta hydrolase [Clostridiales bacterium]
MPYIRVGDLNLFYEDMGVGQPILFLHSHFSRGILAFGGKIQPFQAQHRCLFPDFRGHGRTTCDSLQWNARQIADDMAGFLDALDIPAAHLLAYSFGAAVGMYTAAKYPDRVRSLIAIGAGVKPVAEDSGDYLPERILERNDAKLVEDMTRRHFDAHRGDWQTYMRQTVADWRAHPNLSEQEWRAIRCPTFFINGEHDPFGCCAELRQMCPHAKTLEVKGGGHRPHFVMEQGREVNAAMLDFLSGLDA